MGENEDDWDVEIYVVQDDDGSVLAHSQETDAYEIYGQFPDLAWEVGKAQGITGDRSPEELADHFSKTAETRNALERGLRERRDR